jgi:hypothetical protein
MMWFFWPEIQGLLRPEKMTPRSPVSSSQVGDRANERGRQPRPAREDIPEEDRKKLDALLKHRER